MWVRKHFRQRNHINNAQQWWVYSKSLGSGVTVDSLQSKGQKNTESLGVNTFKNQKKKEPFFFVRLAEIPLLDIKKNLFTLPVEIL